MSTSTMAATQRLSASDVPADLAHECEPSSRDVRGATASSGRGRLVGIDAARGIALLGMFAVHTMDSTNLDGDISLAWQLSSGKSSALFAVLGGIGIAFMTGRTRPPSGERWARLSVIPLVRGALITIFGLLLGFVVSSDHANVILPYLGLMFAVTALLLPLRARTLVALGLGWAVASPIISYLLRLSIEAPTSTNLALGDVVTSPGQSLVMLVLTGYFPVLTWMSYIVLGMGIGRSNLHARRIVAWLVGGGAALTFTAVTVTSILVATGIRERIADDVTGHMSLETFTEYLVWGSEGVLPADSAWWLGINAPHTGTPLDLLYTSGLACLVIGLCLALSLAMGPLLHVLAAPGSMTLTLYSAHLLLLAPLAGLPDVIHFLIQVVVLVSFALAWSSRFSKGPLEWFVASVTQAAVPRPRGRHAAPRRPVQG